MGLFKKTKEEPKRIRDIYEELGFIHAKIIKIEAENDRLLQLHKNLNGRVNKRLGIEDIETENNKKDDGLSMFRI